MKRFVGVIAFVVLVAAFRARADAIDDQYVRIYNVIQEGDSLSGGAQTADALAKYNEAQTSLLRFQRTYPAWNTKVVAFRLNYLAGRMTELGGPAAMVAKSASPQIDPKKAIATNEVAASAKPDTKTQNPSPSNIVARPSP